MGRSLSFVVAGLCVLALAGCRGTSDQQAKQLRVLETRLRSCTEARAKLGNELADLKSQHQQQAEELQAAKKKEKELSRLLTSLEEAAKERERKRKELEDLVKNISGMIVESRPEGDFIVIENDILFKVSEIDLGDAAKKTLDETVVPYLKEQLKKHPGQKVRIDGHTDGSPVRVKRRWKDNYHLSAMRAHSVLAYLTEKGIPAENMYVVGFGPSQPRVEPPEPTAKVAKNRRVEILMVPEATKGIEDILKEFRK